MDNGASSYRRFLDGDESAFREIMEAFITALYSSSMDMYRTFTPQRTLPLMSFPISSYINIGTISKQL